MHHTQLKSALSKYGPQYDGKNIDDVIEAIRADEKGYDEEAISEIADAVQKQFNETLIERKEASTPAAKVNKNDPAEVAKAQTDHPHYKWFDEFQARIMKKIVRNVYANKDETIIMGWTLEKKQHPKFIEPNSALNVNRFMDGFDTNQTGLVLVPKDKFQSGGFFKYEDWAADMGIDPKKDINILLKDN